MRKQKSVVAILLAVMMIFTFMPTMSFALTPDQEGHDFDPNADKSNVKYVVEPTCEEPGMAIVTCKNEDDGICTATQYTVADPKGHVRGDRIKVTAQEYYDKCIKMGYDKEYMDAWMEKYGDSICVGEVYVCKNCGAFLGTGPRVALTDPASFAEYASTEHVHPEGTKACAASFTCELCGKKDATNKTHNEKTSALYHNDVEGSDWTHNSHFSVKTEEYDVHTVKDVGAVKVTVYECNECKAERKEHRVVGVGTTTPGINQFSHPNTTTVTVDPTCTTPGAVKTICTDCGYELSSQGKPALNHDYVEKVMPATEVEEGYSYKQCSRCGDIDYTGSQPVELKIKHSVTATLLAPATCTENSWILVKCNNSPCYADHSAVIINDEDQVRKVGDKYYYTFDTDENPVIIEVPFAKATGHKYSDTKKITEANCTTPAVEGRVCSECGSILHAGARKIGEALGHEVKEVVVPAKCGEGGYTYKVCTRCNEYLSKDGKNVVETKVTYDQTKPVVSLGTKCNYEWKTLEEATPFKLGTRAKVCTVCGDELGATKESVAKTAVAKPGVKVYKGKKKATVTVKAATDAVKYQILVNGKVSKTVTAAGKVNVTKGLKVGKKNTFQIKAFDANDNTAVSAKVTKKIKKK